AIARRVGDRFVTVRAIIGQGRASYALGDLDAAEQSFQDARTVAQRDGFGHEMAEIGVFLALIRRDQRDLAAAHVLAEEALVRAQQDARLTEAARAYQLLGHLAQLQQRPADAEAAFQASLDLYARTSNPHWSGAGPGAACVLRFPGTRGRAAGSGRGAPARF